MEYGRRGARREAWNGDSVRALRRHLGLTQQQLSEELGTRQQTISEWETGLYRPRGASSTVLNMVAERSGFRYGAAAPGEVGAVAKGAEGERPNQGGADTDAGVAPPSGSAPADSAPEGGRHG